MKLSVIKLFISISLIVAFLFSCKTTNERVDPVELDSSEINLAINFALEFFNKSKAGDTIDFTGKITEPMKPTFNRENQFILYRQMTDYFGEFRNMEFAEARSVKSIRENTVYRFKGEFTGFTEKQEIRITIDTNKLVAGFYIRPWIDQF